MFPPLHILPGLLPPSVWSVWSVVHNPPLPVFPPSCAQDHLALLSHKKPRNVHGTGVDPGVLEAMDQSSVVTLGDLAVHDKSQTKPEKVFSRLNYSI